MGVCIIRGVCDLAVIYDSAEDREEGTWDWSMQWWVKHQGGDTRYATMQNATHATTGKGQRPQEQR